MNPERWQKVKAAFEAALDRPPGERAGFIAASCAGDDELRGDVSRLLEQHLAAERASFIDSPIGLEQASFEGRQLGPYRLEALIGRGGMGAVYRAVRAGDVAQRVAVKLMARWVEDDQALQRFRTEGRILARLEHPAIARFIDAGTTPEGQPYLVMEYVEGQPITQHADERRLGVVERVRLFQAVCDVVQYAHRNLVVHRDLKPSNVLVTQDGQPKLLDFGIAKLLDTDAGGTAATLTLARPFTPDYASPEQVRGEPITTASDVYALGVLLYELLTGERPLRVASLDPDEVARVVCHQQPSAPSAAVRQARTRLPGESPTLAAGPPRTRRLTRELRGDLDTIVLTALRKEPARRYPSVEALAEDLRRYLEGRPILARADSFGYRAGKFVRRNPAATAASALLLLSLAGGVAATVHQARVARREGERAERRFKEVRTLAKSVLFEIHDGIRDLPGALPTRRLIVKRSLEYLDRVAQEGGGDPELQIELAAAYIHVGDVQGRPLLPNLGDSAGAIASHRKALAILDALVLAHPEHSVAREYLLIELGELATLLGYTRTAGEEPLRLAGRALELARALVAADPAHRRYRRNLGFVLERLADLQERQGRVTEALDNYRESEQVDAELAAHTAGTNELERVRSQRGVLVSQYHLADLGSRMGQHSEAERLARASCESARRALLEQADSVNAQSDLVTLLTLLSDVLRRAGRVTEARPLLLEAERVSIALAQRDPQNATARDDALRIRSRLADLRVAQGDLDGARRLYQDVQRAQAEELRKDPANSILRVQLDGTLARLGEIRLALGDSAGALDLLRQALELVPPPPSDASARYLRAAVLAKLARAERAAAAGTGRSGAERERLEGSACEHYAQSRELWLRLGTVTPIVPLEDGSPEHERAAVERALTSCPNSPAL